MRGSSGLRILVVDDDAVCRQIALGMLEQLDQTADAAEDGAQSILAASQTMYDVILMDCEMPGIDGFEATRRIRAHESAGGHRAYIVAVTGSVSLNSEHECFDAGMDAYTTKPLRPRRVRAILDGITSSTE